MQIQENIDASMCTFHVFVDIANRFLISTFVDSRLAEITVVHNNSSLRFLKSAQFGPLWSKKTEVKSSWSSIIPPPHPPKKKIFVAQKIWINWIYTPWN